MSGKGLWFYGTFLLSIILIFIPLFMDGYFLGVTQNIGFSVFAAYIFYLVSIFVPVKERQKQAEKILYSYKVNIIDDMEKIIAIINRFIEIVENDTIRSKSGLIVGAQEVVRFKINNVLYAENIMFFIKYYTQQLRRDINSIVANRCFSNLDSESIDNILCLQQSGVLRVFSKDFVLSKQNETEVRYGSLYKDYQEFLKFYRLLSRKQNVHEAKEMTKEESSHYDSVISEISHGYTANIGLYRIIIKDNVGYIPK